MCDSWAQPAARILCPGMDTGLPEVGNYLYKTWSKAIRRTEGLENITCEGKCEELNSLVEKEKNKWLKWDLMTIFKDIKGSSREDEIICSSVLLLLVGTWKEEVLGKT